MRRIALKKWHRRDVTLQLDLAEGLCHITAGISSGLLWEQDFFTVVSTFPLT